MEMAGLQTAVKVDAYVDNSKIFLVVSLDGTVVTCQLQTGIVSLIEFWCGYWAKWVLHRVSGVGCSCAG